MLRLAKKKIEMRVSATGTKVWVSNTLNSAVILLAKFVLAKFVWLVGLENE